MNLLDIGLLVREFYAIEAVAAMILSEQYSGFQSMRHSHSRWYSDFTDFQESYIAKFASAIYDYTALVVAAELRHGRLNASHYICGYYTKSYHRDEIYRNCIRYSVRDIFLAGLHLFDPSRVKWEESYGGEKWYHIAKAGLMKGAVSDEVFIDHCVDLSHNNSIYFDKSAGIFNLQNQRAYTEFLDFKRVCEPQALIKGRFGYRLNRLLLRADRLGILQGCAPDQIVTPSGSENEDLLFAYQPACWGNIPLDYSERNIQPSPWYGKSQRREYRDRGGYRLAKCA